MKKRIFFSLLILFCTVTVLISTVVATGAEQKKSNLKLQFKVADEQRPMADAHFYLHRVAELDTGSSADNLSYTPVGAFADYDVDLTGLDFTGNAQRLTDLAGTLTAYAVRDKIEPLKTGDTDSTGELLFTNLEPGLYLVWGDTLKVDENGEEWQYTPQAMLIPFPYPDGDGGWSKNVEIKVKYERKSSYTLDYVDITVRKVWDGNVEHPAYIVAEIIRNGTVIGNAVLNEENNWQFTWTDLEAEFDWQVLEESVPDGYTVSINQDGYLFTITNTHESVNPTPSPAPTPSDRPIPSNGPIPSDTPTPSGELTPSSSPVPSDEPKPLYTRTPSDKPTAAPQGSDRLPQTGQLWWPVPIMAGSALVFVIVGVLLGRRKRESDDEA